MSAFTDRIYGAWRASFHGPVPAVLASSPAAQSWLDDALAVGSISRRAACLIQSGDRGGTPQVATSKGYPQDHPKPPERGAVGTEGDSADARLGGVTRGDQVGMPGSPSRLDKRLLEPRPALSLAFE